MSEMLQEKLFRHTFAKVSKLVGNAFIREWSLEAPYNPLDVSVGVEIRPATLSQPLLFPASLPERVSIQRCRADLGL